MLAICFVFPDKIAIPDFGTGAMENWGLITYREANLLYDENQSSSYNKQRVASVIAHELVHQVRDTCPQHSHNRNTTTTETLPLKNAPEFREFFISHVTVENYWKTSYSGKSKVRFNSYNHRGTQSSITQDLYYGIVSPW